MTEYHLNTPISIDDISRLKAGDEIYISGRIITARDQAHLRALELHKKKQDLPLDLNGLAVFHCGPIVKKQKDGWEVVAAGPTTSSRMEVFQAEFIEAFGVRVVIGKGGMGEKTTKAMEKHKAIYAAFTGGAAVLAADRLRVEKVEWLDLGMPEAMWVLHAEKFGPMIVAIDSYGRNLFLEIRNTVQNQKKQVYKRLNLQI